MPRLRLRQPSMLAGAAAAAALLAALASAPLAAGTGPLSGVHAVLDGRAIPLDEIPRLHCDDLAYPEITCFRTAAERDASLLGAAPSVQGVLGVLGVTYVTVYDGTYLSGASMSLSQDYATLVPIHWDNRISSMRVWTSSYGYFYTDDYFGGDWYMFCCGQTYNTLGIYNNTFNSVDGP